jgi:hypothetical protein
MPVMGLLASPIVYEGRLVAVAGRTGCHILVEDLDAEDLRLVLLMCLFAYEAAERGLVADDLSERAEAWARQVVDETTGPATLISRPRSG